MDQVRREDHGLGSVFSGHPNFGTASKRLRDHYRVSLTLLSILTYILMNNRN